MGNLSTLGEWCMLKPGSPPITHNHTISNNLITFHNLIFWAQMHQPACLISRIGCESKALFPAAIPSQDVIILHCLTYYIYRSPTRSLPLVGNSEKDKTNCEGYKSPIGQIGGWSCSPVRGVGLKETIDDFFPHVLLGGHSCWFSLVFIGLTILWSLWSIAVNLNWPKSQQLW